MGNIIEEMQKVPGTNLDATAPAKRGRKPKVVANTSPSVENVSVPKTSVEKANSEASAIDKLLAEVEALKKKEVENQKQLDMLTAVADKGRVYNYENQRAEKKPMKVKLSVFKDGVIVGWRTLKDELVKHPTTGLVVGEVQEYEILVHGKDGKPAKYPVNGYPAFNAARYDERIEVEVKGKREDWAGNMTFDVMLPDGQILSMDSRFVN